MLAIPISKEHAVRVECAAVRAALMELEGDGCADGMERLQAPSDLVDTSPILAATQSSVAQCLGGKGR